MPAARGLKRTASKASASGSAPPKIKKKHGVQLEVPKASKQRGRLYACGQGDVGQLGLGEDVVETSKFKFVSALGDKVVSACAGGMHTVALDSDGKVWTFGCNDEGALGRDAEEFSVAAVTLPRPAVEISAGDSHTAALLDDGDVYVWGSFRDSHGSMGLVCTGRTGKSCGSPVRLVLPEKAAGIASGGDHLVVTTLTGVVYTLGCGEQGQLGRLSQRSASRHARQGFSALLQPAPVTLKAAVRRAWAGSHATLALDANSPRMLAWGLNNYGQLGVTGAKKKVALYTPLEADAFSAVDDVDSWLQVACGQHHSLALDNNGKCYAVGRCDYGRLGLGEGSGDSESLALIPKLADKKCVSVAAATSSSFAVTDTGEVYAWGMGSEGQLGTGDEEDQTSPRLVSLDVHKAVAVSAGGQHTVLRVVNPDEPVEESSSAVESTPALSVEPKTSRPRGRARKPSETEVSSTDAMEVDGEAVKKLNGEEEVTPMETDETDKAEEKPSVPTVPQEKPDPQPNKPETQLNKPEPQLNKPEPQLNKPEPQPTNPEPEPQLNKTEPQPEKEEPKPEQAKSESTKIEPANAEPAKPEPTPEPAKEEPKPETKPEPEPAKEEPKAVAEEPKPQEKPEESPQQSKDVNMSEQINGEESKMDVVEKKVASEETTPVSAAL